MAKAIFRNGVKAGVGEAFESGKLYPTAYRLFLAACADRTSGTLQHPELGRLQVKCKSARTHWDANKRDGVDVDVVWVESTDKNTLEEVLANPSPVAEATAAAAALDADIAAFTHPDRQPPPTPAALKSIVSVHTLPGLRRASFTDLLSTITGAVNQVTLFSKQIKGKIDEVSFRLDQLGEAIDKAKDPQTWNMRQSVERLRSSLNDMRTRLLVVTDPISIYYVKRDATLAALSAFLGAPVSQILALNNGLFIGPIVPKGTPIRYYTNLNDKAPRTLFDRAR